MAELRSEGGPPGSPGGRRGGLGREGTLTDGNDGRVDGECSGRGQHMQRPSGREGAVGITIEHLRTSQERVLWILAIGSC